MLALPSNDYNEPKQRIKLPNYIEYLKQEQRIMVLPQNILFFNRIYKTGSSSLIKLLRKLGIDLDYMAITLIPEIQHTFDTYTGQLRQVVSILSVNIPAVWIHHYAFINFQHFGYKWNPDYMNIVRDPIEKVIMN